MWDNPAGKSMMNQGVKMAVAMMYQDFVDGLNLTKEEIDYFKNLLGKEMGDQQELGMKMLGATRKSKKPWARNSQNALAITRRKSKNSSTATRTSRNTPPTRTICPSASSSTASAPP